MSFNQQDNPCKRCALAHWETSVVLYWKHGSSDHFPCTLRMQRGLHCVILLSTLCFHYGRVVVQISAIFKSMLLPHEGGRCGRRMASTCSLDTQQGSARRCHVGAGCPPACRGEVQAPHSSFAWLLLILLLFCFITLMCALLMPFHSRAHSFIQKLI